MSEALIDRMYEAAMLPELWPRVLDELNAVGGGHARFRFAATTSMGWTGSANGGCGHDYVAEGRPARIARAFDARRLGRSLAPSEERFVPKSRDAAKDAAKTARLCRRFLFALVATTLTVVPVTAYAKRAGRNLPPCNSAATFGNWKADAAWRFGGVEPLHYQVEFDQEGKPLGEPFRSIVEADKGLAEASYFFSVEVKQRPQLRVFEVTTTSLDGTRPPRTITTQNSGIDDNRYGDWPVMFELQKLFFDSPERPLLPNGMATIAVSQQGTRFATLTLDFNGFAEALDFAVREVARTSRFDERKRGIVCKWIGETEDPSGWE